MKQQMTMSTCDFCGKEERNTEATIPKYWLEIDLLATKDAASKRQSTTKGQFCSVECAVEWIKSMEINQEILTLGNTKVESEPYSPNAYVEVDKSKYVE